MEKPFGFWMPSKEQIALAVNKQIPDVIAPGIKLLFCGINPGLYTAAIEKHFGRPGNRFWPALFAGGFTLRLYSPFEQHLLLIDNLGITNLVNRATARADEVGDNELLKGAELLAEKIEGISRKLLQFLASPLIVLHSISPRLNWGFKKIKFTVLSFGCYPIQAD